MRAVNLIPEDQRPGGGAGSAGRSGGAAYLLLGGLALLVLFTALWAMAGRGMAAKRTEAAQLRQQTASIEQRTAGLGGLRADDVAARTRIDSVRGLAQARFDWGQTLDDISRVLPRNVWLSTLTGTVAPGVAGGSGASSLRSALPVPAVEMAGCTTSQDQVARLMARLETVPGVQRVSLSDTAKGQSGSGTGGGSGDCRGTHADYPAFSMVLFFAPQPGAALLSATPGSTTTAGTPATTTPPSTTPPTATTPAPTTTTGATG